MKLSWMPRWLPDKRPKRALFLLLFFRYILMCYLSLDPEGYPGTQEYQEWEEERALRAWRERLSYMEEVDFDNLIYPDR